METIIGWLVFASLVLANWQAWVEFFLQAFAG